MRLERELQRLRQRVQQISIEQAPPTLRMVMVKDEINLILVETGLGPVAILFFRELL